ncbi:related to purine transporter azgA [Cephalotrichum gorgonifer]|uniref:ubiquitinyl hydrolase 1 n=1 Tax=Cephalotrichum gorgonifer TaxID=2041049 RepID=A0AAE8MSE5_9PEZI|nr:related to purine transporter azgA [Cephalotrichum gorgonifer]
MEAMGVTDQTDAPPLLNNRLRSRMRGWVKTLSGLDRMISSSAFGRIFKLKGSGHPNEFRNASFLSEIRAGITTFATMAYIIAVNAQILSQTGGTCSCDLEDRMACDDIPSPGMGLNAYFAFQVVGTNGSGAIPYRLALTAVFVEGLVFIFLALTGMRQWLVKLIPATLKTATGVGIGLLLTEIGLSYSAGIGAITGGYYATPLALAGCKPEDLDRETGMCGSGLMSNPKLWAGVLAGGILTSFLMAFRIKYAMVIGITFVSILSWPRNTSITYFPYTPEGDSRFDFFKQVVNLRPIEHTLGQLDWDISGNGSQFALALFTFLYVDIIDATATLYSMVRFCGVVDPKDGDFPRSTIAYCTDAACISLASLFGCSPVTAFIESGAGIAEGGRTGLTAMVAGCCFLISIFFAPIFASIPPWATGCTLILVGCMMIRQITAVNWKYVGDAIPSFVVMAFIPFSYSVAYGLIAGLFVYTTLNMLIGATVWVSRGRLEPRDYDLKEYWTWKGPGQKPWFVRAIHKKKDIQEGSQGSIRIESDAGVFTYLLENLGVKDVQFEELLTLDPSALANLHPVYGVIFLFKFPTDKPYTSSSSPLDGSFDHEAAEGMFFAHQTIQNACGTQALLSVVLNRPDIDVGAELGDFREFAGALPPDVRGEALSNSELIREVHNSFARSSPFVDETEKEGEEGDAFHFIAYLPHGGKLYELDGLQPAPVEHGPCGEADFAERVMEVLQRRVARYDASEIRFNLLAMVRDRRVAAREFGDAEMLEAEEAKREAWMFENALRRHNFVGFAGEVLKGVARAKVEEGKFDEWVGEARARREAEWEQSQRIRVSRKKGGGDVEMGS